MLQTTLFGSSITYNRKSVGPRMKPCGTLTLTGHSCKDFPSRTSGSHLLLNTKIKYPT